MAGVINAGSGLIGQDAGSKDNKDKSNALIAQQQAKTQEEKDLLDKEKQRQLDIANQNKIDILRRRRGSNSLLGDNSNQTTLG